ncbi:AAA family ATPase [Actinomadura barringtoniae]|uniref:AAA family ATPase n=1 Tax=Actinomadura barringtoniae TaxID=1427535 RepID=A0A939T9W8_9ACTN|nr:ATP-binding protein [Actinomadura barringtoniae]MBO2451837.1 AAA family ATPase [Actinomadura barringtoniae]
MTETDDELDPASARSLAAVLQRLLRSAGEQVAADNEKSPLVARIGEHLGCSYTDVLTIEETYLDWEHASLQRGVEAYLAAHSPDAEWFGIAGADRHFESLDALLTRALEYGMFRLGRADYGTTGVGPDETMEVVQLGMVPSSAPDGTPVVLGIQTTEDYNKRVVLTVFAREQDTAKAVRNEIRGLKEERDVLRGQFVSFGVSEHMDNQLVTFLPRPQLTKDDVILPAGRLDGVEEHVIGVARHAEGLLAAGQHLKRGVLLYGPPGTGKTHTVRYLIGRLEGYTVVQLTGAAMRFLDSAVALARRMRPAVIVLEDVDLVAEDREMYESTPLLFSLLDAMDGLAEDADVVFLLTTNRIEVLERALIERPGRVDLAVEIPRPDADGRRALLRLYARHLRLDADLDAVVERTAGVTASYIKELIRRAVLAGLRDAPRVEVLTDAHFEAALEGMAAPGQALTPGLLGAPPQPSSDDDEDDFDPPDDDEDLSDGGFQGTFEEAYELPPSPDLGPRPRPRPRRFRPPRPGRA